MNATQRIEVPMPSPVMAKLYDVTEDAMVEVTLTKYYARLYTYKPDIPTAVCLYRREDRQPDGVMYISELWAVANVATEDEA